MYRKELFSIHLDLLSLTTDVCITVLKSGLTTSHVFTRNNILVLAM